MIRDAVRQLLYSHLFGDNDVVATDHFKVEFCTSVTIYASVMGL